MVWLIEALKLALNSQEQVNFQLIPCGSYSDMLRVSLIDWILEPKGLVVQAMKLTLSITLGGVHRV